MSLSSIWSVWGASLIAPSALALISVAYLTARHLTRPHRSGRPHIIYPLIDALEVEPSRVGFTLTEPLLWLARVMIALITLALLFASWWPAPSKRGSLVISSGPLIVDEGWPQPLYIVSALEPRRSARRDPSGAWYWVDAPPAPLEAQGLVDLPRRAARPDVQRVSARETRDVKYDSVIKAPEAPPHILSAVARWSGGDEPALVIDAATPQSTSPDVSGREVLSQAPSVSVELLTRVEPLRGGERGASESVRGETKEATSTHQRLERSPWRWRALDGVNQSPLGRDHHEQRISISLSQLRRALRDDALEPVLRLTARDERGELIASPHLLCVPPLGFGAHPDHPDPDTPGTHHAAHLTRGLTTASPDVLRRLSSLRALEQLVGPPISSGFARELPRASEPSTMIGDLWAAWRLLDRDDVSRELIDPWSAERVWAPRAPGVHFMFAPPELLSDVELHMLAPPPWPHPQLSIRRATTIGVGTPVMFGGSRVKVTPRPPLIWQADSALISSYWSASGALTYAIGVELDTLEARSPLWRDVFTRAIGSEALKSSARCRVWSFGDRLRLATPQAPGQRSTHSHINAHPMITSGDLNATVSRGAGVGVTVESSVTPSADERSPPRESPSHQNPHEATLLALDREGLFELDLGRDATLRGGARGGDAWIIRRAHPRSDELNSNSHPEVTPDQGGRALSASWRARPTLTITLWLLLTLMTILWWWRRRPTLRAVGVSLISLALIVMIIMAHRSTRQLSLALIGESSSALTRGGLDRSSPEVTRDTTRDTTRDISRGLRERLSDLEIKLVSPEESRDLGAPIIVSPRAAPLKATRRALIAEHTGPLWLSAWESATPPQLSLGPTSASRGIEAKSVQVSALLRVPSELDQARATLYLGDAREDITLRSPTTLIGGLIEAGLDLNALRIKVELDRGDQGARLIHSATRDLEAVIATPPAPRVELWAWGGGVVASPHDTSLKSASLRSILDRLGLRVSTPSVSSLRGPLPDTVRLIALSRVTPDQLTTQQLDALLAWVKRGGTLYLSGELSAKQRQQSATAWRSAPWSELSPLSLEPPIDPLRQAQVAFLIDRSGSTAESAGGPGLSRITTRLSRLVSRLAPRDEVMVVSFGGGVEVTSPPRERALINELPVPTQSRGGTLARPALELTLTYRRPSLLAHWVIITDGEWGDESGELSELIERLEVSGVHVTIAITPRRGDPRGIQERCDRACRVLADRLGARVIEWGALGLDALREPLSSARGAGDSSDQALHVEGGPLWSARVGGELPSVSSFSKMGRRAGTAVLAEVSGYPLLAERSLGQGRVIQLMSDVWALSPEQRARLLSLDAARRSGRRSHHIKTRFIWDADQGQAALLEAQGSARLNAPVSLYRDTPRGQDELKLAWRPTAPHHDLNAVSALSRCDRTVTSTATSTATSRGVSARGCSPSLLPLGAPQLVTLNTPTEPALGLMRVALPSGRGSPQLIDQRARALNRSLNALRPKLTPSLEMAPSARSLTSLLNRWATRERSAPIDLLLEVYLWWCLITLLLESARWRSSTPQRDQRVNV